MALNTFLETDLFRELTDTERLKVERFSATRAADLPKFFNAGTQRLGEEPAEPISKEFEAYLILQSLQSPDKLSNAMKWFTEAADLQIKRKDRDDMLEEAFGLEKTDALAQLQEVRNKLERYTQFRAQFEIVDVGPEEDSIDISRDRFVAVPEMGLIFRDSQAALGEVASKLTRLEHLVVQNEVVDVERKTRVKSQESVGGIADDRIAEELLSWRDVISQVQARVTGAGG